MGDFQRQEEKPRPRRREGSLSNRRESIAGVSGRNRVEITEGSKAKKDREHRPRRKSRRREVWSLSKMKG